MGSSIVGSTKIAYTTKDKMQIEYIYYDLKGKNRFPEPPCSDKEIQIMFNKVLSNIDVTNEQMEILKEFGPKYQHRFVVLHGRKVEEYKEKSELYRLRRTKNFDEDSFKSVQENKKKELDEKLKLLESNETAIKMHLGSIDRYIAEKNFYTEFIKIDGISRLIKILDKAIHNNKQGTKTIFQNQIQILKFLKSLSDHSPKEYFSTVATIHDYTLVLLRAYHPVNIAVTAYVLMMLQDYAWKVENSITMVESLKLFKEETKPNLVSEENKNSSFLQPFAETIYNTDNILMCYYNLKFVNELLISIVDDDEKSQFEEELRSIRYEWLIEDIKNKLQENYFKIDKSTFIHVSQAIYKYATKQKKEGPVNRQESLAMRTTLNLPLQLVQHHILANFIEDGSDPEKQQPEEDDDDDYITVYLADNDKKAFNKFLVDTLTEIQHFYKYTIMVDEGNSFDTQQVNEEMKKQGLSMEQYVKRIKGSCMKNTCEDTMIACFKSFQYFDKAEWKKIQAYINEGMKMTRAGTDSQSLKKQIQDKDKEVKNLKKELYQLKSNIHNNTLNAANTSKNQVSKLDISKIENADGLVLPPPPPTIKSTISELEGSSVNSSTNKLPNLPPPPPPPALNGTLPLPPPPPPTNITVTAPVTTNNNLPNLPPLPPPPSPSGLNGLPNLPPPPPPPSNIKGPNLPPLPPPPSSSSSGSGTQILPPPPPPISSTLPPPPPPPIGGGLPPPPPPIGGGLVPPPPPVGGLPPIGGLVPPPLFTAPVQKKKPILESKVKLKACNYIVLKYDKIKDSFWQKLDEDESKVKINREELEEMFPKTIMMKKAEEKMVQSSINLNQAKSNKKETVTLLSPERNRNFQIILTSLKYMPGLVPEALTQCSGKYAINKTLESLKKLCPTEEEEAMVSMYEGEGTLGRPEQFIQELVAIPQYQSRIESLIFANIKEEIFYDIQTKIEQLTTAFQSFKDNYRLHHVLKVALAVGNYLNGNGNKGGAWGFRLDSIQNMQEVTSTDNKMNAGFFVIKEVWKTYAYPIFDKEEVEMYQYVSKMPTSQVKSEIGQLRKYKNALEKAYKSKDQAKPNDLIDAFCEEHLTEAKAKLEALEKAANEMEQAYTECAKFYCEDPSKGNSDDIGKKMYKSVLFIFNTEKMFFDLEEKRKKEEARKAPKNEIKYNAEKQPEKSNVRPNPEAQKTPKMLESAVKLPMPMTAPPKLKPQKVPEATAEKRLQELQKDQQQKEKKFLQQMMKKRSSKMMAFRASRANNNLGHLKAPESDIDFLKGV